jgi:hypothetical protein
LYTTNPTWIDPGANPGLSGERPVTNDLSHGTALWVTSISKSKVTLSRYAMQAPRGIRGIVYLLLVLVLGTTWGE